MVGAEEGNSTTPVETTGGVVTPRVDVPRGDRRSPLSRAEPEDKVRDGVDFSGSGLDPDAHLADVWDFGAEGSADPAALFRGLVSA